ncbi:MAG: M48 family metalloprotease [Phormidesmis sp. RL_2_1]|nr:M48 family metalloprotease [Phormidesmis sp. RL_2_1]
MSHFLEEEEDNVNVTPVNPLVNLAYLMATVGIVGAAIYGISGIIATQLAVRMDTKTEEKIGAAMTEVLRTATLPHDTRISYLEGLLGELQADVAKTTLKASSYPPLKVAILDDDIENAMVAAGSYLFVTDGLLQSVETENELAFVLAHELGHLHHRDPLKALGRGLMWATLNGLLGLGQGPTALTSAANLASLSYSRNQETAADDYALALTVAHYQHGDYALDFFERIQAQEFDLGALSKIAEWQQTHPLTDQRIQRLEKALKDNGWPTVGQATPLPNGIACPSFECE